MPSSPATPPPAPASGLQVRPFRALTYRRRDSGYLARVSSPAYDLVTPEIREQLAAADPHNVVQLILPETDRSVGRAVRRGRTIEHAARTLAAWERSGVLEREAEAALWVYELRPQGSSEATVGWLGAVALPPPGSRAVLPHEDTFPAAVEGRRALLAATRTDLEPIVLAHDPHPAVPGLTDAVRSATPDIAVVDGEGVTHRLWRVSDPELVTGLCTTLAETRAVIADGHHRFAAAQAHARATPEGERRPSVLALLTPVGPGGLQVEAIHRVLPELDLATAAEAAGSDFTVTALDTGRGREAVAAAVHAWQRERGIAEFLVSDGHRLLRLHAPSPAVRAAVPAEAPAPWRNLEVVLAHRGLIQLLWGRSDEPDDVLIAHDVAEALRCAEARAGVALLLRAASPGDVAAVARAGARMPRKSTLFVPKPRTGLIFRPHEP